MNTTRIAALFIVISTTLVGTGCNIETCEADTCEDIASSESYSTDAREPGAFDLFEGQDGQYYFRLESANGETVLRSEGYTRKAGAENGIASVETNGVDIENYQIKEAKDGSFYFNLRAGNYQVIGTSEMYSTKYNAERGAEGVANLLIRMLDHVSAE